MLARIGSSNRYIVRGAVLGALLGTIVGLTAVAQPPRPGRMAPEDRAKVNTAQAQAVAADLKLDAGQTGKLVEAHAAFLKQARENRPRFGRGDWEAMRKHQEEQRAKFAGEVQAFLEESQATAAAEVLVGFHRGWDQYVSILLDFDLEEAKEAEALGHTLAYVKAASAARGDSVDSRDFRAMRANMMEAKKILDESLAPLLSEEQQAEWTAKTAPRMRESGQPRDRSDRGNRGRNRN